MDSEEGTTKRLENRVSGTFLALLTRSALALPPHSWWDESRQDLGCAVNNEKTEANCSRFIELTLWRVGEGRTLGPASDFHDGGGLLDVHETEVRRIDPDGVDSDVHATAVGSLTSDGCSEFCGSGSEWQGNTPDIIDIGAESGQPGMTIGREKVPTSWTSYFRT